MYIMSCVFIFGNSVEFSCLVQLLTYYHQLYKLIYRVQKKNLKLII